MTEWDAITRYEAGIIYEVIAECYKYRYRQMAPGKSAPPVGPSIDDLPMEENSQRFQQYLRSPQERDDLIAYVLRLQNELEEATDD